ncbi:MAG: hypothetical protein IIY21_10740 [Clostridiales bacterium]|nr:hypothetical protein [Clostridiales bacterium]
MIDYDNHSFWLSSQPAQKGAGWTYSMPPDESFFYLGGSLSFSYSNTYSVNVVGIPTDDTEGELTRTPEDAYFTDTASGSVATFSISCIRAQPLDPDDTGINACSNAKVQKLLRSMKNAMQLAQGAYILRIYNNTQNPNTRGIPYDIPVYLDSYNCVKNQERPFELNMSLQFTKRSPIQGINIGSTIYSQVESQ